MMTVSGSRGSGSGPASRAAPVRRRVTLGVLSAAGTALFAAACGGQVQTSESPALQPATIRYLHVVSTPIWSENWGKIFSTFETKYPHLKVAFDPIDALQKVPEKAIATVAGGDYYDMLYGHFTTLSTLIDSGVIQPLDAFLAKDRDVKSDDFFPAATERLKGKLYGLAWFTQGKELWYNADLLAQAGAPLPAQLEKDGKWTWDAVLDVARKATRYDGESTSVYGFTEAFTDFGTFCHNLWAYGADWYDKGLTRPTMTSDPFLTATQFMVDLVAKHRVSSGGDFTKGQVAMQVTSGSALRAWEEPVLKANLFKVGHTMMPKGPSGRQVAMANNCNYICKASKAPEATWLFEKHLLSKEVQPFIAALGGGRYMASKKVKPTTVFPVEDAVVYEASAALSRPTPLIVKQADLQMEWVNTWNDTTQGKRGVRDALTQLQARAEQLLKDGGCLC
jgi:ABC-type glycerol-3-phosphate transport system substrate-binding protein